MTTERAVDFVRSATLIEAPKEVAEHVQIRTLDTLAAVTAGYQMSGIDIVCDYAQSHLDGAGALLLDGAGNGCSATGATLANSTAANTLDIDDGHREVKGHPAAVVVPPALAAAEVTDATVGEFLDAIYVGYEIGIRAGLAIHATDNVYTGTGSWGAVGAAAAVARLRELAVSETAHALGTAEYYAPRTPIMRGVAQPGMTKDGVGWGAYVGAVAVDLASRGFTGSGTIFDETSITVTDTLGVIHRVTEGYFKPYPCCRWTHPGIDAILELRELHEVIPETVKAIRVHTFTEATHLNISDPDTIEEAEYSYPYTIAAALVCGQFTTNELRESVRETGEIQHFADRVCLSVDEELNERFPEECLACIELDTREETYRSGVMRPRGTRDRPLTASERKQKIETLCRPTLNSDDIERVQSALSDRSAPVADVVAPWQEGIS